MLTKNKVKEIRFLSQKKYRQKKNLFIVEGEKAISEFLNAKWNYQAIYSITEMEDPRFTTISKSIMSKITQFSSPSPVLGVFEIQKMKQDTFTGFSLAMFLSRGQSQQDQLTAKYAFVDEFCRNGKIGNKMRRRLKKAF